MTTAVRDVPRSGTRDERQGAAIVVGASLAGLMTASALSHAGVDVTMLERSGAAPRARKGAALGGVSEGLLSRITGSRHSQGHSHHSELRKRLIAAVAAARGAGPTTG
ncbi:FAD-dependent monooxygenase [Streptomyces turgidiscabies]|uniref:FAD-dependent monooxygenase n=1 Tax=Streptomyces TaxID=1883 RepID=UPI0005C7F461|nr:MULTISPECIES: FAD-dependent monooxygenase [Streptomyces]MDX3491745.1 FAD-dependent monooxygenase [Streptomyces turgidiscabies]GAQ72139.1 hypothetical protein T45_03884 [Streptomyces turgidiscabies]